METFETSLNLPLIGVNNFVEGTKFHVIFWPEGSALYFPQEESHAYSCIL